MCKKIQFLLDPDPDLDGYPAGYLAGYLDPAGYPAKNGYAYFGVFTVFLYKFPINPQDSMPVSIS